MEENWQTTRSTIRERSEFMFNNNFLSDVKFAVRGSIDGGGESKMIPAHKFVLSISSPVFLAMFYGELAETADSIYLPDCEYEALLELFRYMYSDKVNLTETNVMELLYLAKKYMVPSLADRCSEYLLKNLGGLNVFSVLPNAQIHEAEILVDRCWEVIDKQTEEAVTSEGFVTIEKALLEAVIERDSLNVEEIDLFKAVDLWAAKECGRQGLEENGETKRKILGERIVKGIRFPVMKQEDFVNVVDSNILTTEEVNKMTEYFNFVLSSPCGFTTSKRSGTRVCQKLCRFGSTGHSGWNYTRAALAKNPTDHDVICLKANKDILLYGIRLFGSQNNSYTVNLHILDLETYSVILSETGTFLSDFVKAKTGNYYGFDFSFKSPVTLNTGVKYKISAAMTGPPFCGGGNGLRTVQCEGVTFRFYDKDLSYPEKTWTCIIRGQFPIFFFTLK